MSVGIFQSAREAPIKIAVVGHKDFIEKSKRYIDTYENTELYFYNYYGPECASIIETLSQDNIEVIIAGQVNSSFFKDKTEVPIVPCRPTFNDILGALQEAKHFESDIIGLSLVRFEDFNINSEMLSNLAGRQIVYISHNSHEELEQKLQDLKALGVNVVVGSMLSISKCEKYGLKGIPAYSVEKALGVCIEHAIEIARVTRRNLIQKKMQGMAMDYANEGIIHIDRFGCIVAFNNEAKNIFNITAQMLNGRPIDSVLKELQLTNVLKTGEGVIKNIEKIMGQLLLISRIPIKLNGFTAGAVAVFQKVEDIQRMETSLKRNINNRGFEARYSFKDIVSQSSQLLNVIDIAKNYARSDLPILIEGETGTGKELFAQSIHNFSLRKNCPFVAINCASLPESLLESELFGYEAGSFTGASHLGKKGLFEIAHKGTLFLDEINSIPISFQVKLLRAIEEQEIIKLGGNRIIPVDVRIISSTNEVMSKIIQDGSFRKDLFYRVGTLKIEIPPLRERREDLPCLIRALSNSILNYEWENLEYIQSNMIEILKDYHFPGNIRELRSFMERFFILVKEENQYSGEALSDIIRFCIGESNNQQRSLMVLVPQTKGGMIKNEKENLLALLQKYQYNKTLVAKQLGCGRNTLYRKMQKLGINY